MNTPKQPLSWCLSVTNLLTISTWDPRPGALPSPPQDCPPRRRLPSPIRVFRRPTTKTTYTKNRSTRRLSNAGSDQTHGRTAILPSMRTYQEHCHPAQGSYIETSPVCFRFLSAFLMSCRRRVPLSCAAFCCIYSPLLQAHTKQPAR